MSQTLAENLLDLDPNPEFRASTLIIFNDEELGHAFLYEEKGNTYMGTAQHTAELATQSCTYVVIPGANQVLLLDWWRFTSSTKGEDFAFYTFSQEAESDLETMVDHGYIEPLFLASEKSVNNLTTGENVYMPRGDTGLYTIYQVEEVRSETIWIATDASQGIICEGRSGGPALNEEHNVIGLISGGDVESTIKTDDGTLCYFRIQINRTK